METATPVTPAFRVTRKIIPIQVKWNCAYDGHKFGGKDSNGFKTCSECGLTVKA